MSASGVMRQLALNARTSAGAVRAQRLSSPGFLNRHALVLFHTFFLEYGDGVIQRKFAYMQVWRPPARAHALVPVYQIGQTFASHQLRRVGDLEMQVRLAGISGTAHTRQHLTSPHDVAWLDTQAPRLKMHIVRKLASA